MDLKNYAEMVYFQFYRKVEEVDFFLNEAINNALSYKDAPIPKDNFYFDKMQFTFSAYINALVSSWEIVKLSKSLSNVLKGYPERKGLVSEFDLETKLELFIDYFDCEPTSYYWFRFMKEARNANAHDGSLALNGGNVQEFLFRTDLHRYKWDKVSKVYEYAPSQSPKGNALCVMLKAALALVPIFEKKLERPELSLEDHYASAKFKVGSIPFLMELFPEKEIEIVESMVQAQLSGHEGRSCNKQFKSWCQQLECIEKYTQE